MALQTDEDDFSIFELKTTFNHLPMLAGLQRELKELLAQGQLKEVMRQLKEDVLDPASHLFDKLVVIQGRLADMGRDAALGLITTENKSVTFNGVNDAVIWLIGQLTPSDLHPDLQRRQSAYQHVPVYHAYAVNRFEQAEKFELDRLLVEDPNQKVHFYYLYGDVRQEIPSLIQRLGHEMNGHQFNAQQAQESKIGKAPLIARCKPEPRGNKQLFRILLLKNLLEQFVGPVNNMREVRQKTLLDLMESPKLSGLTPSDSVCILVTLDDYNWRKEVVPEVLQGLYTSFCKCDLPDSAPNFYFFFGVEYRKENTAIKAEVAEAIAKRKYGEALDELMPVSMPDVAEWFTRHPILLAPGQEAHDAVAEHFSDATDRDMIEIESKLLQIIEAHNRQVMR
ncbi:hypothetical protein CEQ90_08705 [Lewinellaceae bacterium SD302]|nr:hypothetical protein CEQ90_08705 [Lewinellaceae bacterium SD302]